VHNNYFFLQSLSNSLSQTISGGRISDCYTQEKNELILIISVSGQPFTLRAYLQPSFSCLFFPDKHKRAKRNTVDVFKTAIGKKINGVKQHLHERAFSLLLENDFHLTFKMFGNRANAVLFRGNETVDIFRSKLKQDLELKWNELDRELDLSAEAFRKTDGNPTHFLPVLGKILTEFLFESGYKRMNPEEQYKTLMKLYQELQSPFFYLIEWREKIHLSLVPLGEIRQTFEDPFDAINTFFLTYLKEGQLKSERQRAVSQLSKELNRGLRYVENNRRKLKTLQEETNYRVIADLIMANLHRIKGGEKTITGKIF
jgi:predicted ribosome quality control (RQC) complex YloA/Tae2 family protein